MERKKVTYMVVLAAVVFAAGVFGSGLFNGPRKDNDDATASRSVIAPASGGNRVLTVGKKAQQLSGIVTERLKAFSRRALAKAYGQVLDVQSLIDLRNSFVTAQATVKKSVAQLMVSRNEYNRVRSLFNFNKNVSIKDLQSAESAYASDRADSTAAVESLSGLKGEIRREWGDVITKWISSNSQFIGELIENKISIILITVPSSQRIITPSSTANVEASNGRFLKAEIISNSPRTNAAIQGFNYFYRAPADPELSSGTNVVAYLPIGPVKEGVVIPGSAVVWWNGSAWVYIEKTDDTFQREKVSLTDQVTDGWFVAETFETDESIVVRGAQILLSQESNAQTGTGGDDD
jgi:hypothetical protein